MKYNPKTTEFEVHATAYAILRKRLYPRYLVRGCLKFINPDGGRNAVPDISIFEKVRGGDPVLKVVVETKRTPGRRGYKHKQIDRYSGVCKVPCVIIRGMVEAFDVMRAIEPVLHPPHTPPTINDKSPMR